MTLIKRFPRRPSKLGEDGALLCYPDAGGIWPLTLWCGKLCHPEASLPVSSRASFAKDLAVNSLALHSVSSRQMKVLAVDSLAWHDPRSFASLWMTGL
jgi:RecA/RadA recombinase